MGFIQKNHFFHIPYELIQWTVRWIFTILLYVLSSRTLVYLEVSSISTAIPISLSQSSRQLLYRYFIHAKTAFNSQGIPLP
jgi:hypothetical protein